MEKNIDSIGKTKEIIMRRQQTYIKYCDSLLEAQGLLNAWPTTHGENSLDRSKKKTWAHIDHYQIVPEKTGKLAVLILWREVPREEDE